MGAKVTTSGGLTKSGAANLDPTNPVNTYTGATTINAGSLVIDGLVVLGGNTLRSAQAVGERGVYSSGLLSED
jgi:autotransporter-associated beta strand protein